MYYLSIYYRYLRMYYLSCYISSSSKGKILNLLFWFLLPLSRDSDPWQWHYHHKAMGLTSKTRLWPKHFTSSRTSSFTSYGNLGSAFFWHRMLYRHKSRTFVAYLHVWPWLQTKLLIIWSLGVPIAIIVRPSLAVKYSDFLYKNVVNFADLLSMPQGLGYGLLKQWNL